MNTDILDLLRAPARQSGSLRETSHRPWPAPTRSWLQGQTWDHLLFAHWRVDADELRTLLPGGLELDLHGGDAWLGITPFRITGLRLRGLPPAPVVSEFLELNVRTYVTHEGKPGIWFLSLDAESRLAAEAAKLAYRLPYRHARIEARRRGEWIDYRSARPGAGFDASYRPTGPVKLPEPSSLEHFLTERYCLYTEHAGALHRAEIHHAPWPLQEAEAEIRERSISPLALEGDPLLHYSERQDVVIWPLEAI